MKKHLYILSFIIIVPLIAGIIFIGVYLRESYDAKAHESQGQILESNLFNAVTQYKNKETSTIDFAKAFPFAWDKVYFFGPYTPTSKIDSVLGRSWFRANFLQVRYTEGITLIVFTKEGEIVDYLEYSRGLDDFEYLKIYTEGISIEEAKFVSDENGRINLLNK